LCCNPARSDRGFVWSGRWLRPDPGVVSEEAGKIQLGFELCGVVALMLDRSALTIRPA